jgi:hypothetical protein
MCYKTVDRKEDEHTPEGMQSMRPVKCKFVGGHRICKTCWFGVRESFGRQVEDPRTYYGEIPFADERSPHGCPGCQKGLPVNEEPVSTEFIELD